MARVLCVIVVTTDSEECFRMQEDETIDCEEESNRIVKHLGNDFVGFGDTFENSYVIFPKKDITRIEIFFEEGDND